MQRVQKYVEALDVLKVKNATKKVEINKSVRHKPQTRYEQRDLLSFVEEGEEEEAARNSGASSSGTPAIVSTKWEMFDHTSAAKAVETVKPVPPRYKWEFFD